MSSHADHLRSLCLECSLPVPGVYDNLSARLSVEAGFEALLYHREVVSAARRPRRKGPASFEDTLTVGLEIQESTRVPVVVDWGKIPPTVRDLDLIPPEALQAVAAIAVGDSRDTRGGLVETATQQELLAEIARRNSAATILIAHTGAQQVEEAQRRARAYLDAGAEWVMVGNFPQEDELEQFITPFESPIAVEVQDSASPLQLYCEELAEMGYAAILFPWTLLQIAAKSMEAALALLAEEGSTHELLDLMASPEELELLLGDESGA